MSGNTCVLYIQCEFKLNSTHYDTGNNNSKKTRKPKGRSFIIYHCYVTRQYILTLSIYITDKNKGNSVTKRQAEDPICTPKRSSRKINESTTPQSNTSTLSTKSTTSSGTTASLRKNVARGLNLDNSDGGSEGSVYYKPIEQINFFNKSELRKHALEMYPERRSEIMSAGPSALVDIVLRGYETKNLKGLLAFWKAKYSFANLGCIEDHENKSKNQLIKEFTAAIGKVTVCRMEQQ